MFIELVWFQHIMTATNVTDLTKVLFLVIANNGHDI